MMFENKFAINYKTVIFVIMSILILIFVGKIMDIAIMFFGAFIIASSVLPVINKLKNYMPRGVAVSIILLAVLAGFLVIFIPLGISVVNKTALFIEEMPQHVSKLNSFLEMKIWGHSVNEYINLNGFENIGAAINAFAGNILSSGLTAGKVIANSITSILVVSIMVFYLCADEEHMKAVYLSFFPPKFKKKAGEILDIIMAKVGGYIVAQVLSMAAVGIITLFGLLIIGHKQAVLVGFLTFVLDLIPVVGPTIAVITGLVTALDGSITLPLLTLAVMIAAQWVENQLARPVLFGKFMDIHPLLVIISLLAGAKFLGFAGVVLGPAFASFICVLVNELYIKQINK